MGKGVAFGKKVGQTIEVPQDTRVYSLKELTERGDARETVSYTHLTLPTTPYV